MNRLEKKLTQWKMELESMKVTLDQLVIYGVDQGEINKMVLKIKLKEVDIKNLTVLMGV